MGGGEDSVPAPAPVPVSPSAPDNSAAQAERDAAANAAVAERANAGRKSTIFGGMKIAEEDQANRGMLAKAKRESVRAQMGL